MLRIVMIGSAKLKSEKAIISYDIKKEESSTAATTQNAIGDIHEDSSDGIVPQNGKDVNTQFSLSSDSDGRQLSDGQKEYFKDSKVVDENGNLKVVYHGSPTEFNTFSLEFLGTNGTAEGYGFYFTELLRQQHHNGERKRAS